MSLDHYETLSVKQASSFNLNRINSLVAESPVSEDAPAVQVLHDFRVTPPAVVFDTLSLEQVAMLFTVMRVRYFLVENSSGVFQGILSLKDTMSPRLLTLMQQQQLTRADVQVRDAMTPRNCIYGLSMQALAHGRVGDVLHTLDRLGESFLLVTEGDSATGPGLRGLLCAGDIARRIGVVPGPRLRARTFSELRHTLLAGGELDS